jgi:hypothetical protein
MNLAVKFNLLIKDTKPHYIYKPESCLENDNYKLYFDRTVLTDIHIQHNSLDIIILNKQQKQEYLLDVAVPNSHNITQIYGVSTLKVEHRQLTLCLLFIDIMPLFRYINNIKELNYNIKVINSLSSFYYKFFEKITMQFLP